MRHPAVVPGLAPVQQVGRENSASQSTKGDNSTPKRFSIAKRVTLTCPWTNWIVGSTTLLGALGPTRRLKDALWWRIAGTASASSSPP